MEIHFSPDVRQALDAGHPVVALESTLITHGLPQPENLDVARQLESTIQCAGATPATMAILRGCVHAGLSDEQLVSLAQARNVRKCSRRDLPVAAARKEDGATTVAATMLIAHAAGIPVFATGGIGGVHRGHPFDVSADLVELGNTPITVVCAGAKAILDLPLTLEVLETYGVPVIGYQTDTFPAFYSRDSGLPVNVRCDTPEDVAAIILERDAMALKAGILVAAPVPEADELPPEMAEAAIRRSLDEAEERGIAGKDVTPFLLARVSELTGTASRRANVSLLKNNAAVAAAIAVALAASGV